MDVYLTNFIAVDLFWVEWSSRWRHWKGLVHETWEKPKQVVGALTSNNNTMTVIITRFTLWKSSNCTPATAPRILDAIALQASPTKSGTEKSLAASLGLLSPTSKCLKRNKSLASYYPSLGKGWVQGGLGVTGKVSTENSRKNTWNLMY